MNRKEARRCRRRRAFSLIELGATLALIALFATVSFGVVGVSTWANLQADGLARQMVNDLAAARRSTIASGENHFLTCTTSGAGVTSYRMMRRAAAGNTVVDQLRVVPANVTLTTSHSDLEFDFDGAALHAFVVDVEGPTRSWRLTSSVASGLTRIVETTP